MHVRCLQSRSYAVNDIVQTSVNYNLIRQELLRDQLSV